MPTFDLYHTGNAPPAAPDVSGSFTLRADWVGGQEHGERQSSGLCWTHIGYFPVTLDIRDAYTGNDAHTFQDTIYVPDQNGTAFVVTFIENLGTVKRVYLDRGSPNWPTNDI